MRWMKHLANARHDEKMALLLDEHGPTGYGVYWLIIEIIGEKVTDFCTKVEYPERFWRRNLGVSYKKLKLFLDFFEKNKLLFVENNGNLITIDCPNILKYRDEYTDKQIKKSGQAPDTIGTKSPSETDTETEEETEVEESKSPPLNLPPEETGSVTPSSKQESPLGLCDQIAEAYHEILPGLPPYQVWGSGDQYRVQRNAELDPARGQIDFWRMKVFIPASRNKVLSGREPPDSGWKPNLSWFVDPDHVADIQNGKWPPNIDKKPPEQKREKPKEYPSGIRPIGSKK